MPHGQLMKMNWKDVEKSGCGLLQEAIPAGDREDPGPELTQAPQALLLEAICSLTFI
jgi:hypothetical protein